MAERTKRRGEPTLDEMGAGGSPSVVGGAVWGVVAYVLTWIGLIGLGAYHASTAPRGSETVVDSYVQSRIGLSPEYVIEAGGFESEPLAEALLWTFYGGHGTPLEFEATGEAYAINVLEAWAALPNASAWTYLAVPALALAVCGFVLASRSDVGDPIQGAIAGAFVAVGYGALFAAGLPFATAETVDGAVRIGPATSEAILRGLAYPLVAGGAGGALAGLVRS